MGDRGDRPAPEGFEPWVKAGFGVCLLAAGFTLYLASRPGGARPVQVYGLWFLPGLLAAALMLGSLIWGATHRPLLQRGRLKGWLALSACLWWSVFPFPYPSSHEGHPSRVRFELPFSDEWQVVFAGNRYRENPLVLRPESRFGAGVWREEPGVVLAPCPARVVGIDALAGLDERSLVQLEVAEGQRLVLRGLRTSSLEVEEGQQVGMGEVLGKSERLELYLHDPHDEGIPMRFVDHLADGRLVEAGELRVGTRISPRKAP